MKKLIFLIFAIIGLISCKNRDQDFNTLPEVTDWGANTAGALVDGKVWVATTDRLNTANGSGTYCEKFNNNYTRELDLRQEKNSYNNAILIKVLIIDLELNKKYMSLRRPLIRTTVLQYLGITILKAFQPIQTTSEALPSLKLI